MTNLVPVIFRLDGLSRVVKEITEDTVPDYMEADPGHGPRLREKIYPKYRNEVAQTDIESIVEGVNYPEHPVFLNTRGSYHHLTYGFLKEISASGDSLGYLHIDNHSDDYTKPAIPSNYIGPGTFVQKIGDIDPIEEILLVGSFSPSFSCISSQDLFDEGWETQFKNHLDSFPEEVYISLDLDVFRTSYLVTNYDQGFLDIDALDFILDTVRSQKTIIGADICGLERPYNDSDLLLYSYCLKRLLGIESSSERQKLENM